MTTGSEYLRSLDIELSPLGVEVADFLADWHGGMHNAIRHTNVFHKETDWSHDHHIWLIWGRGMATFDFDELTKLVVMSHDRMLRVEIRPYTFHHVQMLFHKRSSRIGDMWQRMPTLESHVERIRASTGQPIDLEAIFL